MSCNGNAIPTGMPPQEVAEIVTAVADALDYAHERNLLHRDVKPANILLANPDSRDRRILLADFGIARWADDPSGLTATNMTVGTVSYAAPEQLMGEDLDGRSDQYALAATAFHLLTGSPPFPHSNPAVVISQHLGAAPPTIGSDVLNWPPWIRCCPRRWPRTPGTASNGAPTSPAPWRTGSATAANPTRTSLRTPMPPGCRTSPRPLGGLPCGPVSSSR